jgi:hypothetical protein
MDPVHNFEDVMDAIQRAKAGATDFRTNFFPAQPKLASWVARRELWGIVRDGASFFFRKDRDFWHFYFCVGNLPVLQREVALLSEMKYQRVVVDLIGSESANGEMGAALQSAGLRPYARLQRMSRAAWHEQSNVAPADFEIVHANKVDAPTILKLIECHFDRFSQQLPTLCELESAAQKDHILSAKLGDKIGAVLFFETQGLASIIRFWLVDINFRARRLGSALMLAYFATHDQVRRFTLWVNCNNEKAIQKYRHYGYESDGLVDQVLVSSMIST